MTLEDLEIGDHLFGYKKGTKEGEVLYTVLQIATEKRCIWVAVHGENGSPATTALRWLGDRYRDLLDDIDLDLRSESEREELRQAEAGLKRREDRSSVAECASAAPQQSAKISRRSRPDHRQISAFVLRSTANEVKSRLAHMDKDLSTLVQELLEAWLVSQPKSRQTGNPVDLGARDQVGLSN